MQTANVVLSTFVARANAGELIALNYCQKPLIKCCAKASALNSNRFGRRHSISDVSHGFSYDRLKLCFAHVVLREMHNEKINNSSYQMINTMSRNNLQEAYSSDRDKS